MFFNDTKSTSRPNIEASARVVKNNQWINTNLLELGMYVNELDKPWEQTRFLFQGFRIDSYETLRAVQEVSDYANVQIEKLARAPMNSACQFVRQERVKIHGF